MSRRDRVFNAQQLVSQTIAWLSIKTFLHTNHPVNRLVVKTIDRFPAILGMANTLGVGNGDFAQSTEPGNIGFGEVKVGILDSLKIGTMSIATDYFIPTWVERRARGGDKSFEEADDLIPAQLSDPVALQIGFFIYADAEHGYPAFSDRFIYLFWRKKLGDWLNSQRAKTSSAEFQEIPASQVRH